MSTVYSAVDERLDRLVAVKVMSAALSADPAFIDRFSREARAAARLAHVNAVAVYDQGQDDTDGRHVFLVMELVEGRTLRDLIRERNGRFTPAEAISIMEPVLAALASAHRAGLVHRDIKPENILLSDDGLVKVADFGLARAIDSDVAATRTGLMMGTVAYCAPEQIVQGRADQRSDVYAAGIVLFELLTGRPPYSGDSAMNVAYQHVHSRVPAPSTKSNGIPNEIDELVIAATDTDPSGRPADAGAFLAEIAEIRSDLNLPITAIPARPREGRNGAATSSVPLVRPMGADSSRTEVIDGKDRHDTQVVPRNGRASAAVAAAEALPLGAGKIVKAARSKGTLSPRQRRRRRTWIALAVLVLVGLAAAIAGVKTADWYQSWNTHVPKVVGQSQAQATLTLEKSHYTIGTVTSQYSDNVQPGVVLSTTPSAGTRLQRGKSVSLVLSLGAHTVLVPSVAGMSPQDAEAKLRGIGLQFGPTPTRASSTTVKNGLAIGTDPPAGKSVHFGSAVTLIVSTGPPLVNLPQLQPGETYDQYHDALVAAKFQVSRQPDQFSDSVPSGQVISVNPDPAQNPQQPLGSTVQVTVSKGPQSVVVPNFQLGQKVSDAENQLQQLGLQWTVQTPYGGDGKHLLACPQSGQTVNAGSTITLIAF